MARVTLSAAEDRRIARRAFLCQGGVHRLTHVQWLWRLLNFRHIAPPTSASQAMGKTAGVTEQLTFRHVEPAEKTRRRKTQ